MKSRLALAAALAIPLGLAAMPTAVEYLPATLDLRQGVRLADGSVLPAGHYDVQIHFKGWGTQAIFYFFQHGASKGKLNAEARGFPSSQPVAVGGAGGSDAHKAWTEGKVDKAYVDKVYLEEADKRKGELEAVDKHKLEIEAADKHKLEASNELANKKFVPAGGPAAFSWGGAGFQAGGRGTATLTGNSVKISFDSSNSAAGFSALVPAVMPAGK